MSRARTKKKKRAYAPEVLEKLRANMARAREVRAKKKLSGVGHAAAGDPPRGAVHVLNETAAPDTTVMSVANIEAIWAAGEPTHGLELQAPNYTEQDEDERKPLMQTPVESYSEVCCTCELTITKLVGNPRILIASTPLLAGEQHVIVGNSENFIIGMKIPVIRNPPNPAYWLLNGPLPRSKGRW